MPEPELDEPPKPSLNLGDYDSPIENRIKNLERKVNTIISIFEKQEDQLESYKKFNFSKISDSATDLQQTIKTTVESINKLFSALEKKYLSPDREHELMRSELAFVLELLRRFDQLLQIIKLSSHHEIREYNIKKELY